MKPVFWWAYMDWRERRNRSPEISEKDLGLQQNKSNRVLKQDYFILTKNQLKKQDADSATKWPFLLGKYLRPLRTVLNPVPEPHDHPHSQ